MGGGRGRLGALFIKSQVANWNSVFGTVGDPSGEANPFYAKGRSLVGMVSHMGWLLVNGPHRNNRPDNPAFDVPYIGPPPAVVPPFTAWNGLSMLYGPEDPAVSFDPCIDACDRVGRELWSGGSGICSVGGRMDLDEIPFDEGMRFAVPEGSAITVTNPFPSQVEASTFLFVANYCGAFLAGHLLVQDINFARGVEPAGRIQVPVYELLADALESGAFGPDGALGAEVPREHFTCPASAEYTEIPNCDGVEGLPSTEDSIKGNKLRPVAVIDVPLDVPYNGGRKLVVYGMNLDPIDPATYGTTFVGLDGVEGLDDGKYDYIGITDITQMVRTLPVIAPLPNDLWHFQDLEGWRAHTTFLRLPADVAPGWTPGTDGPDDSGYAFSYVNITKPGDPGTSQREPIRGSGTPKTLAGGPEGRFLYVITSDQNGVPEQMEPGLADGGWHVPHLYVLDLSQVDVRNQTWLSTFSNGPNFHSYRFNKVIYSDFDDDPEIDVLGSVCVQSTIPGFPRTSPSAVGPTRVGGADLEDIGPEYPGEYQFDPTIFTKLRAVRNPNLTSHPNRLYMGLTGRRQGSSIDPAIDDDTVGAVVVLSLDEVTGEPSFLRMITLPHGGAETTFYNVTGLSVLSATEEMLGWNPLDAGEDLQRNVYLIVGNHNTLGGPPTNPQDRLLIGEDP